MYSWAYELGRRAAVEDLRKEALLGGAWNIAKAVGPRVGRKALQVGHGLIPRTAAPIRGLARKLTPAVGARQKTRAFGQGLAREVLGKKYSPSLGGNALRYGGGAARWMKKHPWLTIGTAGSGAYIPTLAPVTQGQRDMFSEAWSGQAADGYKLNPLERGFSALGSTIYQAPGLNVLPPWAESLGYGAASLKGFGRARLRNKIGKGALGGVFGVTGASELADTVTGKKRTGQATATSTDDQYSDALLNQLLAQYMSQQRGQQIPNYYSQVFGPRGNYRQ